MFNILCHRPALVTLAFLFALLTTDARAAAYREHPFPVPPELESSVEFWKQIFTRYSTSELVFYDTRDPTRVYKVVNVGKRRNLRQLMGNERKGIVRKHRLKSVGQVSAQRGVKERFVQGLQQSQRYLDQMQEIFRKRELPVQLAYLPLIESAFQVNARSRAGAVGMWQFMHHTGKSYLRITSTVDERKDPLESTRAAASMLEENYEIFGNWPLAITAYNHGRAGIQRAVARVGSSDIAEIIQNYRNRRFGVSSKNFYAEFIAAVEVAGRDRDYVPDIEYDLPLNMHEFDLEQPIPLSILLRFAGISRQEFLGWNPALHQRIHMIPKWYRVKVPSDRKETLTGAYEKIVNGPWVNHRVARGETLSHIAETYSISIREIQSVNGLSDIHLITIGQQLKIPKR